MLPLLHPAGAPANCCACASPPALTTPLLLLPLPLLPLLLPAADQEVEGGLPASWDGGLGLLDAAAGDGSSRAELGGGLLAAAGQPGSSRPGQLSAPGALMEGIQESPASPGKQPDSLSGQAPSGDGSAGPAVAPPPCPAAAAATCAAAGSGQQAADAAAGAAADGGDAGGASWQTFCLIWGPLSALTLSSAIALTLFPFFTYVPTSGLLGESLPKVGGWFTLAATHASSWPAGLRHLGWMPPPGVRAA